MLPAFEDAIRCQAMRSATACGDPAQAVELGQPGEERAEGSELPFLLGRAYLQDGQLDAAERNLTRALGFGGTTAAFQTTEGTGTWRPLLELGALASRRGDAAGAAERWHAAVTSAPELPGGAVRGREGAARDRPPRRGGRTADPGAGADAGDARGSIAAERGGAAARRHAGRLRPARGAVRAHPERPEHWHWLGSFLCQVGEVEAASEVLGQAIELHQGHAGIYLALGTALQKLGLHEDALNAFGLASALDPESEVARAA